jgi:hypothetical protein
VLRSHHFLSLASAISRPLRAAFKMPDRATDILQLPTVLPVSRRILLRRLARCARRPVVDSTPSCIPGVCVGTAWTEAFVHPAT